MAGSLILSPISKSHNFAVVDQQLVDCVRLVRKGGRVSTAAAAVEGGSYNAGQIKMFSTVRIALKQLCDTHFMWFG